MKYGVLIQDIDETTFDHLGDNGGYTKQYVGSKAGDVFTFGDKMTTCFWSTRIESCSYTKGLSGESLAFLPTFVMAEISEEEYNRLKALKEPKVKEYTMEQLTEKLGENFKLVKEN